VKTLSEFLVQLHFHESLRFFLRDKRASSLGKVLHEKTSVKDVIESCGVPHPEVDLILVDQEPVDFAFVLRAACEIEIFGVGDVSPRVATSRLQSRNVRCFVADGHLGKLTRLLRLLGIDVAYDRDAEDRTLVKIASSEKRALLTRDRRLLMHAIVGDGYYPRSQNSETQTVEVVRRFQLQGAFAPYTRCLRCNTNLVSSTKDEVFPELEPLTKIYYENFCRCPNCGKIYWAGSHFPKLETRVAELRAAVATFKVA
jgi:hypothetical protein